MNPEVGLGGVVSGRLAQRFDTLQFAAEDEFGEVPTHLNMIVSRWKDVKDGGKRHVPRG